MDCRVTPGNDDGIGCGRGGEDCMRRVVLPLERLPASAGQPWDTPGHDGEKVASDEPF